MAPFLGCFKPESLQAEPLGAPDLLKNNTKTINPPGPILVTAKKQPEKCFAIHNGHQS